MENKALIVDGLIKSYGDRQVLKGVSFYAKKGEILALLGGNGAGKTTTLECIEGLRTYDAGTIELNGKVGVQLQNASLPPAMKGTEALALFSKWSGSRTRQAVIESLGMAAFQNKTYRSLSTGQQRRLHLALALLGEPDILFLDEPTAGLDVEGRAALHQTLRQLNQQGMTIVLASHDMAEVEQLSHRVAIIKDGAVAFCGAPSLLHTPEEAECTLEVCFQTAPVFHQLSHARILKQEGLLCVFETDNLEDALAELCAYAKMNNNHISDVRLNRMTLEQKFLDFLEEA